MKSFRLLAVSAAVLAFFLAVLGSWVRINGAGMTCPDWPLCRGSVIPQLQGGVIYEWTHRLIALVEGFVLLAAVVSGWRMRKRIGGVTPVLGLLGAVFVVQVALGGITVRLSNRPDSVVYHWATAMLLLAALTALAVLSIVRPERAPRVDGRSALLAAAAAACVVAMCAGAFVSSSGAGLACSGFPGCGAAFWGRGELQAAQMLHRGAAACFAAVAIVATAVGLRGSRRAAITAGLGLGLVALQIALGVANVVYALPTVLREAHAANAAATFVVYVAASVLAAIDSRRDEQRSTAPAFSASQMRGGPLGTTAK